MNFFRLLFYRGCVIVYALWEFCYVNQSTKSSGTFMKMVILWICRND